jgi:hypothetical protein
VTGKIIVHDVDIMTQGGWRWDDQHPSWQPRPGGRRTTFDACPGYAHDPETVRFAAATVETSVPLLWDIHLYSTDRETLARSNGHSDIVADGHYEGDTWVKDPVSGLILLSGKRIPPHPAMTRYLVAHEAGHNVEWMLVSVREDASNLYDGRLLREYAALPAGGVPAHRGVRLVAQQRHRGVRLRLPDPRLRRGDRVLAAPRRTAPGGRCWSGGLVA